MDCRIVKKDAFVVAGRSSYLEDDVWGVCHEEKIFPRLDSIGIEAPESKNLGLCYGCDGTGKNKYMVGVETVSKDLEGLDVETIPASTWLVFEAKGPLHPNLGETWHYIYHDYLPNHTYKQRNIPTIEKYCCDDVDADDNLIEIWIPVEEN